MPDLCLNKVGGDFRRKLQETTVTHYSDLLDFAMMVPNKSQMGDQGSEILQTGQRLNIMQYAMQLTIGLNEWIYVLSQFREICGFESPVVTNEQDTIVTEQFVLKHRGTSFTVWSGKTPIQ